MFLLIEECVLLLVSTLDDGGISSIGAGSVLSQPVRRAAMTILINQRQMTRRELAEKISEESKSVSATDPDTLEVSLHYNHLPRLNDELYVEYDPRSGDVVLWEDPQVVARQLSDYE